MPLNPSNPSNPSAHLPLHRIRHHHIKFWGTPSSFFCRVAFVFQLRLSDNLSDAHPFCYLPGNTVFQSFFGITSLLVQTTILHLTPTPLSRKHSLDRTSSSLGGFSSSAHRLTKPNDSSCPKLSFLSLQYPRRPYTTGQIVVNVTLPSRHLLVLRRRENSDLV